MKKIRILIADKDQSYMRALVNYMIGIGGQFEVSGFTDVESFVDEENDFSLALLNIEFIDALEKHPEKKRQFGNILYLTGTESVRETAYDTIYKFQSMSRFMEKIHSSLKENVRERANFSGKKGQRLGVIYSPMHHELTLPFALSMAKLLGENAQTLFVDMEAISVMPQLLERDMKRDLGDYLFHILGKTADGRNMTDFLGFYENFYYLAPMRGLGSLASVTIEQWMCLLEELTKSEFEQILLVMDQTVQGMDAILQAADDILLLGKPGEYYETSMRVFAAEAEKEGLSSKCRQLMLPMSVSQQAGEYAMGQMMNGKLGGFIRKEFLNVAGTF